MLKKSLVILSMTLTAMLLFAGPSGLSRAAGSPTLFVSFLAKLPGAASSGMQVQNLDPLLPARMTANFFPLNGGSPISVTRSGVAAGAAANFYPPGERSLANGGYAAIVSADRPLAAITRTDWSAGGAAIVGNAVAGREIALPAAFKRYGGLNSIVLIQNTDTGQSATVAVEYYGSGGGAALLTASKTIGPGTSVAVDLATDPAFAALPGGTAGGLIIKSPKAPVAVQVFVTNSRFPKAIYAFEGQPVERAAARLYAPLIRNEFQGTSYIVVVNPGDSTVEVSVNYITSALTPVCTGIIQHGGKPFTIAAKGSAIFAQANVPSLPTGDSGLPLRCLGSAVIDIAGGKVLAMVTDADLGSHGSGTAAAYNAFSDADGAKKVALPLWRSRHSRLDLSTGVQVMNIGDAHAYVRFEIETDVGLSQLTTMTIPPLGSYTSYPPSFAALPSNTVGSATLTSDQPIVVIVNDASSSGATDSAIYSGIKAD
jgi:hypothetical protein